MNKIKPNTFPRYKPGEPHPLIANMPKHLKDHANWKKINKAILNAGASSHSHSEIVDWGGCYHCQRKQWERKEMMRLLGFESGVQYLVWQKVHSEIERTLHPENWVDKVKRWVKLPKYNEKN